MKEMDLCPQVREGEKERRREGERERRRERKKHDLFSRFLASSYIQDNCLFFVSRIYIHLSRIIHNTRQKRHTQRETRGEERRK